LVLLFGRLTNTIDSVADPGCLSRIPDPDFSPSRILDFRSRIPDPKTATKERGEKNMLSYPFFSHKFHNIVNYYIFEMLDKKIWLNFKRITELFTQKIVTKLKKYGFGISSQIKENTLSLDLLSSVKSRAKARKLLVRQGYLL
jgi:hypothetical protein